MPVWCERASLLLPFYFIFLHFVCPFACTVFPRVIVLKQTNKQSAHSFFFFPLPPLTVEYILLHILLCVKALDVIPDFDDRGGGKEILLE